MLLVIYVNLCKCNIVISDFRFSVKKNIRDGHCFASNIGLDLFRKKAKARKSECHTQPPIKKIDFHHFW